MELLIYFALLIIGLISVGAGAFALAADSEECESDSDSEGRFIIVQTKR
ncbi:hypothetical protein [Clostridium tertium]|nr:hypothetical protein [Clostridium tertium]